MIFLEILQLECNAVPELPPSRNPLHNCTHSLFGENRASDLFNLFITVFRMPHYINNPYWRIRETLFSGVKHVHPYSQRTRNVATFYSRPTITNTTSSKAK